MHAETALCFPLPEPGTTPVARQSMASDVLTRAYFEAVTAGQLDTVNQCLENGIDINNTVDSDGWTGLMNACKEQQDAVVQLLLSRGADITRVDKYNWNAIFAAACAGHASTLMLLFNWAAKGGVAVDLEQLSTDGMPSGFLHAVHRHSIEPSLFFVSCSGRTALFCAASNGYLDAVALLLDHGAVLEHTSNPSRKWTALISAAVNGMTPMCKFLLEVCLCLCWSVVRTAEFVSQMWLFCPANRRVSW